MTVPVAEAAEPEANVRVCMWTSSNMDGQKRIWLRQMDHLSRPPYSSHHSGMGADAEAAGTPIKFIVLLTSESIVAPDMSDPAQVQAFQNLEKEYLSRDRGGAVTLWRL